MKKSILILCMTFMSLECMWSQCVFSCYNYTPAAITFSVFPNAGVNAIPLFSPTIDDGITSPIPLGFNFSYYCGTYSAVLVCSNGFLQFDIGSPPNLAFANPAQAFPDPTSPNGIVALNMSDFDPNVGGSVTYTTIGITPNQKFILTYSNVPIWTYPSALNTGQIVLYETSNIIEIHTGTVSNTSIYNGTQGTEDANGTLGNTISGRSNSLWSATNSAYRWVPVATYTPAAPPTTTITGLDSLCQGTASTYSINPSAGASFYTWYLPGGWLGSSTLSAISTTAISSGNMSVTTTYTCGTSLPVSVSVAVVPSPFVSLTAAPNNFCSGITVTLNATGASAYTLNPMGITTLPPYTDTPLTTKTYSISGKNSFGCLSQNIASVTVLVRETPTVTVNSGSICLGESFTITPNGASTYVFSSTFSVISTPTVGSYSYSVTGTATNLCVGSIAISNLTVVALPNVTAVATKTAICLKEKTVLTAGGATSFTWNITPPSTVAVITVSPNTTTIYMVTGIDANGCINSGTVSLKVNACTGLDNLSNEAGTINVYPNPNNGIFTVYINSLTENAILELYNSVGQLITSQKINSESVDINLKNSANGLYYLKLKDVGQQTVLKVIKE